MPGDNILCPHVRVCRCTPNCILEYHVRFADESQCWLSAADLNAKVAVMAPKERAKMLVIQRQLDRHLEQRAVSAPVDTASAALGKTTATPEKDAFASADRSSTKHLLTRPTQGNIFRIEGPDRTASSPAQPATPLSPEFITAQYSSAHTGLEVQERDGAWRSVTLYAHVSTGEVVLWFGEGECEGIGCGYRWGVKKGKPRLLDGDGCKIPTRATATAAQQARESPAAPDLRIMYGTEPNDVGNCVVVESQRFIPCDSSSSESDSEG